MELSPSLWREQYRAIVTPDGKVQPGSESGAYEHEDSLGTWETLSRLISN